MKIGSIKEKNQNERRVSMTPASAIQIIKLGHECYIEEDAGLAAGFSNQDYIDAGVKVINNAKNMCREVDILVKVQPPTADEVSLLQKDKTLISFFYPGQSETLLNSINTKGSNVLAMDMVPRISRAQKMDALSSMANIAGYRAVIEASNNYGRFFTGQVTAAGKIPPAKILIIGAGVAGLAAIGAATSLGAQVYAFDVRPEVAEQIESMGAEFVFLDFDETQTDGSESGGYAAPSSPEFREKQLEKFTQLAPNIDIVITTALIPGREAPKLWLENMVLEMRTGSVVIDLAAERGGNCELTVPDQKILSENGVTIIGYTDFPSRMAAQSSELYSTNIRHMISDLTPEKDGIINHDMEDDVIRGATVCFGGEITFPPPPPKIQAIAAQSAKPIQKSKSELDQEKSELLAKSGKQQTYALVCGAILMLVIGAYAPSSFMQHFIVFCLSCFVGFQVIWNVSHSLHTPLMAVTNAISGIIILGALLQMGSSNLIITILASISVLIATINIVGGFMVTRRMLQMFQKS
jgi:NAD(P) transhydrogenase subunit alpha